MTVIEAEVDRFLPQLKAKVTTVLKHDAMKTYGETVDVIPSV
jgi:hypothetical protein